MADYAIAIKACSKIVSHALSSIKTKAMLWILFSGFAGLFTVYLYPNFFLLGPLRDVNFTASLTQVKDLSVDLITYFMVIQTYQHIHKSTLLITQHMHNDRHWAYFKYY